MDSEPVGALVKIFHLNADPIRRIGVKNKVVVNIELHVIICNEIAIRRGQHLSVPGPARLD